MIEQAKVDGDADTVPHEHRMQHDFLLDTLIYLADVEQVHVSPNALTAGLPLENGCLTPQLFARAASRIGLNATVVMRELTAIVDQVLPAVVILQNNRAQVLLSIDVDSARVNVYCPQQDGLISRDYNEFLADYSGLAIYVSSQMDYEKRLELKSNQSPRHWFWQTLRGSRKIYRDVLIASFLINVFVIANPLFVMNVYDRVVPNAALETLWALALGIMVLYIFDFILKVLRTNFIEVAGKKADILLSQFIFERVLNARYESHPQSVGAFVSQLRDFDTVRNFVTSATITAFVDLPFVVLFLVAIAYIGGPLVWVPIIAAPLILGYSLLAEKTLKAYVAQSMAAATQKSASLVESLTHLSAVKFLGAEGKVLRRWEKAVGAVAFWGLKSRVISTSATTFAGLIAQLSGVFVVIVGVYLIADNQLTQGGLIASVLLSGRALAPMAQVSGLLVQLHQARLSLTSLDEIVNKPQERDKQSRFLQRTHLRGDMEFRQVHFAYPNESSSCLNDISLTIASGEKIAIIGRIGSGKSTLQKLLLGLYRPLAGQILMDGIDMSQIDPACVRANMGYVPQESALFYGSIRDNIHYGQARYDDEEMLRVAEIAGVSHFVNVHPNGYERNIGERGEVLSGGQRQAVSIARALVGNPSVLLLDEPTSAMDNASEARFMKQFVDEVATKTLILVTHKMSLLSLVDRVIVMDKGRIVADGPRDSVVDALKKGQINVS